MTESSGRKRRTTSILVVNVDIEFGLTLSLGSIPSSTMSIITEQTTSYGSLPLGLLLRSRAKPRQEPMMLATMRWPMQTARRVERIGLLID